MHKTRSGYAVLKVVLHCSEAYLLKQGNDPLLKE